MKQIIISALFIFFALTALSGQGQYKSKYPDVPVVDVHFHPRGANDVANLVKVSETIKQKYGSHLAFWVSLNDPGNAMAEMKAAGKNRILFATGDYRPHKVRNALKLYPGLKDAMGIK